MLGWTCVQGELSLAPMFFYLGAIFWTLGYDTIYGYQDIKDDEIIGLKSTSIKFKDKAKFFLFICYALFSIFFLIYSGDLNAMPVPLTSADELIVSEIILQYFICFSSAI